LPEGIPRGNFGIATPLSGVQSRPRNFSQEATFLTLEEFRDLDGLNPKGSKAEAAAAGFE
jgi:hypothetical protein